jgi:hypothetical protein
MVFECECAIIISGLVVAAVNPNSKLVTRIPLQELWRTGGIAVGPRRRTLNAQDIAQLLREGQIEFAVADVGRPLLWIDAHDCYDFWKADVRAHLAEPASRLILDSFPGGYCYIASEWEDAALGTSVVLLEKHH